MGKESRENMKILHTADWHIGKVVNQVHMTKDQEYILDQLIELIQEEKPDVMIIAGDLYDRGVPPVEAVQLLDRTFCRILKELKTPIITIAGNHDSADRLSFASEILKHTGLHIGGRLHHSIEKVVLQDDHGPVNFYIIPYGDPAEIRHLFGREEVKVHDDGMRVIIESIEAQINTAERNIAVAHGYVMGTEGLDTCESERPLAIGGTESIRVDYFKKFNYTALGHLHSSQKVQTDRVRYSGSLLKYSFSEVKHKKGVTMVTMDQEGQIKVEQKELKSRRDMRIIKGELNKLLDPAVYQDTNTEDYLHVVLTDEGELMDPISKLRAVYPNVLSLELESKTKRDINARTSAGEGYKQKTKVELFYDFYCNITGKEFTQEKKNITAQAIEVVEQERRWE